MRTSTFFPIVALLSIAGCFQSNDSVAPSGTAVPPQLVADGNVDLGPSPGQFALVSIALPVVGDVQSGEGCEFSVEITNIHFASANHTWFLATQFLTNGTSRTQPMPMQFGSSSVAGDSLASQTVAAQAFGTSFSQEVWVGEARGGSPSITARWSGKIVASDRYFDLYGITPISYPVLNLMAIADEAPAVQTFQVAVTSEGCKFEAAIGSAASMMLVKASDFESALAVQAGVPWIAQSVDWSGALPAPGNLQIWAINPPRTAGESITQAEVHVDGRFAAAAASLVVGVETTASTWRVSINATAAESQARIPIFFAAGLEVPDITFAGFWGPI